MPEINTDDTWRTDSAALARVFSALGNPLTGLGTGRDKTQSVSVNLDPYILGREELSALPRSSAILKRVITLYPEDAGADWITFTFGHSDENPAAVLDYMRDLANKEGRVSIRAAFVEASIIGRQYGDGFCLLGVADGKEPSEPIDWDRIKSLRWIKPVSRYHLRPEVSKNNGQLLENPEFYVLNQSWNNIHDQSKNLRVLTNGILWNSDRVLRFPGDRLSSVSLGSNNGYNDSVLQGMFNAWSAYQQGLMASSAMLADYSQMILKSEHLAEQVMERSNGNNGGRTGEQQLINRLLALDMGRSVARAVLIDKTREDAEYVNRSYGGADSILKALLDEFAAASDMPRDKLLGQSSASGISNHPGEHLRFDWAGCVSRWQNANWRSPLEHVCRIILSAADGPTRGEVPDGWGLGFVDTFRLTDKEKLELRKQSADIDQISIPLQIYTPQEARSKYSGAEFSYEITLSETDHVNVNADGLDNIRVGTEVSWRWGNGTVTGKVTQVYNKPVTLVIEGKNVTRNGSRNNPALQLKTEDGKRVLKLSSEVRTIKNDIAAPFRPLSEVLPGVNELLSMADVSNDDVVEARDLWHSSFPDEDYRSILDALESEN